MKLTATTAILLLLASAACAQSDAHLLLDDWTPGKRLQASTDAQLYGRSSIGDGQSTQFSRVRTEARYRFDPTLPMSPTLGVDWTHLELSSHTRLANQLDDASFAIGSPLFGDANFFGGGSIGAGYAGDEAFAGDDAWYGKANVFVGRQMAKNQTLLLAVDYDGNRTLLPDVPIPSMEYDWKIDDRLELAVGFPAAGVDWKITPKFKVAGEYDFPNTIIASAEYQLLQRVAVQLRYLSDDDAFHVDDAGYNRRIFYQDQRLELGLVTTLVDDLKLDTAAGYGWDRKFKFGFDDRDSNSVGELDDQFYLRLGLELEL